MNHLLERPGALALIFIVLVLQLGGCSDHEHAHDEDAPGHAHGPEAEDEYERGPNNGRLLRDGELALEITIFETGVPPEFRVYPFRSGLPLDPGAVELVIELHRLGGVVDRFEFAPQGDLLRGDGEVTEPHSFAVSVMAIVDGKSHRWSYESFEGRTAIEREVAAAMGVTVETAGPGIIRDTLKLQGNLVPDPSRHAKVQARFAGQIQSLNGKVGDRVARGEVLATVLSNESLQTYTVTAPIDGTIVERAAAVGMMTGSEPLFVITDDRLLLAELRVFSRDVPAIEPGQSLSLHAMEDQVRAQSRVDRVLPTIEPGSGAGIVHAAVDNEDGSWRVGQAVTADITVAMREVPLAVRRSGLQAFRDFTVVYARVDDTYEVRMLELGQQDEEFVEVLGGLEPGTIYVTGNSYLIKADIEKSGASHDH